MSVSVELLVKHLKSTGTGEQTCLAVLARKSVSDALAFLGNTGRAVTLAKAQAFVDSEADKAARAKYESERKAEEAAKARK